MVRLMCLPATINWFVGRVRWLRGSNTKVGFPAQYFLNVRDASNSSKSCAAML